MTESAAPARARLADRPMWRLSVHFFRAMFDFGVLSDAGADSLKHMFAGGIGGFVSAAWLMVIIYVSKYLLLWFVPFPGPYRLALLGDDMFMVGMPMLVGAFVTLLVSSSLFPDERDFRILGPLPIRRGMVFGAKLTALVMFVSGFVALTLLSLLPLFLLTTRNPWGEHVFAVRLAAWLLSSACASVFAMLAVAALTGLLGLLRASARLQALTTAIKSAALVGLVLCLPLVVRLSDMGPAIAAEADWLLLVPPAWFVGLERVLVGASSAWFATLAWVAIIAMAAAAAIVAALYALLFRHFERLVLQPPIVARDGPDVRRRPVSTAMPGYLSVRLFTGVTLRRGALHQGVLVGLAACGLGIAVTYVSDDAWRDAILWVPFAVIFTCGVGVRASLVLPIEHRANWIFRVTEDSATRADQLRAMDDIAAMCVVAPAVGTSLPLLWVALGERALVAGLVIAVVGLLFVHVVLLDWRRVPFTCSYLPGKRFVAQSFFIGIASYIVFVLTAEWVLQTALSSALAATTVIVSGLAGAYLLRRRRLETWAKRPLMFEDEFPDALMTLQLWQ